ncbi:MAG: hypothetical protein K1X64_19050 [Myxococcaceae bacterium]|nr:hypothetical protein [Myxococcaceae bacterium]
MLLRTMFLLSGLLMITSCGTLPPPEGTGGGNGTGTGGGADEMRKSLVSGSRLKARVVKGADGSMSPVLTLHGLPTAIFFDSQRNEDCWAQKSVGGVIRCLPMISYSNVYGDASCTGLPLVVASDLEDDPITGEKNASAIYVENIDTVHLKYFGPGTEHTGPIFYLSGSNCAPTSRGSSRYYVRGSEILPTEFVEMKPGLL